MKKNKSHIKLKKIFPVSFVLIFFYSFLSIFSFLEAIDINPTTVAITIQGNTMLLKDGYVGIEKKGDDYRLILSMVDRDYRVKAMLSAILPQGPEKKQSLNTFYDDVLLTYRSAEGSMMIAPEYQLTLESNHGQDQCQGHNHDHGQYRHRYNYDKRKKRRARIQKGEGVVRNKFFAGTFLSVLYKPIVKKNGKTIEAELHFTGHGKFSSNSYSYSKERLAHIFIEPIKLKVYRGDL